MRVLTILLLSAGLLPAQQRYVVDAAGGGHFRDLPAALANAVDGDVFEVRPGIYTPAIATAGVRIVGTAGCSLARGTFFVRHIARSATFTLSDFDTAASTDALDVRVEFCAGPVLLQRLRTVTRPWPYPPTELRLRVVNSPAVAAHECAWQGAVAVRVQGTGSQLSLTSSGVRGLGAVGSSGFQQGHPGMEISGASVAVVDSTVFGADGSSLPRISGGIGVVLDTAASMQAAGAEIRGGWSGAFISQWREPSFSILSGSSVVLDPSVLWHNTTTTRVPLVRTVPAVTAASVAVGGTIQPAWSGGLGAPSLLAISLAGPPLNSPWGTILLDPGTTSALWGGPAVANPPGLSLIPAIPSGTAITLQGAVALPTGLALTTAQTFVVR